MHKSDKSVSFEEDGTDFRLVRIDEHGNRTDLYLTEANVVFLNRLSQQKLHQILARRTTIGMGSQGIEPLVAVPVVRVQLGTDLHRSKILLKVFDDFSNETGFALPREIAEGLVTSLPRHLAQTGTTNKAVTLSIDIDLYLSYASQAKTSARRS